MLLLSLPFLVIFVIGCNSMYLLNLVLDEVKQARVEEFQMVNIEEEQRSVNDEFELLKLPADHSKNNMCVICLDKERDSIFYPCGHECVCQPCGKQFMDKAAQKMCPICRNRIKDIIKVFRS